MLIALLASMARVLSIDFSFKYFKHNMLHTFVFLWLILDVITMITIPSGLFLNPYKCKGGENALITKQYIINFFNWFDNNTIYNISYARLWVAIVGITLIVLTPIFINDIIKNRYMTNIFIISLITMLVGLFLGIANIDQTQKMNFFSFDAKQIT